MHIKCIAVKNNWIPSNGNPFNLTWTCIQYKQFPVTTNGRISIENKKKAFILNAFKVISNAYKVILNAIHLKAYKCISITWTPVNTNGKETKRDIESEPEFVLFSCYCFKSVASINLSVWNRIAILLGLNSVYFNLKSSSLPNERNE
jgi:hypothetical protein